MNMYVSSRRSLTQYKGDGYERGGPGIGVTVCVGVQGQQHAAHLKEGLRRIERALRCVCECV